MGRNRIGCALALMVAAAAVAGCGPKAQGWNSTLLKNELVELRVVPEIGGRSIGGAAKGLSKQGGGRRNLAA